jgi:hypothetical protein
VNGQRWQAAIEVLRPLDARLDAALFAGDVESAVRLAFSGAQEAAALVAGSAAEPGTATLHKVYVELTPLPLDAFEDGTLGENGAYVDLEYGCESFSPAEACKYQSQAVWLVDSS